MQAQAPDLSNIYPRLPLKRQSGIWFQRVLELEEIL